MNLTQDLIEKGVLRTPLIVNAFEKIDRKDFVPEFLKSDAYADIPLPIGSGQTISQPYTVAFMLELLQPHEGDIALDAGSGSGWQTALLAEIVGEHGKVMAYERIPELFAMGRKNIEKYGFIKNGRVEVHCKDATQPHANKFDCIVAAAAARGKVPSAWLRALRVGGRLVLPIDTSVWCYTKKTENDFDKKEYPGFAFVPLVKDSGGRSTANNRRNSITKIVLGCLLILFMSVGFATGVIFPPRPNAGSPVTIERGMNAEKIAGVLKEKNIIRSKLFFVWAAYFSGVHNRLAAGSFSFGEPLSLFGVLNRLLQAQPEVTILVTEGMNLKDIQMVLFSERMVAEKRFLEVAQSGAGLVPSAPSDAGLEGFLFPDTYRFYKSASAEEVIKTMLDNFFKKIEPLKNDIENKRKTVFEIVTMASIIEKEAKHKTDLAIVSGILWKRIGIGMLLQADATLFYTTGKTSRELTVDDLKSISPYNTYVHKGLPPGPIGNPGLDAIRAAVYPADSGYLYYLSDGDGVMHYARTFEEHKLNKARYIKAK